MSSEYSDRRHETSVLRKEVRAFLEAERNAGGFIPEVDSWLGGFDAGFSRKLGARGWIGMTWPERFGGQGLSNVHRFVLIEELLAAGAPVAAHWFADRQVGPAIIRLGTPFQQEYFLPRIVRGELFFAVGLSEPDSGSDLASVQTRAEPNSDGWRIRGTKLWTSGAHACHNIVVLCRSERRGADPRAGLSQFIVDLTSPGVTVRPIRLLNGEHHFNEVQFDDVQVGPEALLGEVGAGWSQVTAELGFERSGPERFLSTLPLLEAYLASDPSPEDSRAAATVGSAAAELWSLRQLSISVAGAMDTGEVPALEATIVKDLGTRYEQRLVDDVRSLVGACPPGSRLESLLRRAVEHSPGFTLRGGTNEVLRSIVAKGLGI
ncbi:acyl-CoA dehydrogenase family protein [Nocardia sp. NPDC059239]|uniref:acyl-CoA dehydrogenase family protein n=1 Tax=unclassified Nocardia TaxID=2637762 RepID=UPI0036CBE370